MNDMSPPASPAHALDATSVRIERVLPGPIERVWSYLTDPKLRATWFSSGDYDLRAGGDITLAFDHANISHEKEAPAKYAAESRAVTHGTIVRIEPPRLLAFDWRMGGENSEVTFELEPCGSDVRLTVTHRRLQRRELQVSVASGWDAHLAILAARLTGREPPGFWSLHTRLEREYEANL